MIRRFFSKKSVEAPHQQEDPNSFGNIAIEKGFITQKELEQVLKLQEARLGEILVKEGMLTSDQRDEIFIEQKIRKGEKVSPDQLRVVERKKMRRHLQEVTDCFKEASSNARETASAITAGAKALGG